MSIAITGATGQLGQIVVAKLLEKLPSSEIIAVVRSLSRAAGLNVSIREASYGEPEALANAFAGVETVLLISSSEVGQRLAQHENVIAAAKAAGVRRVVYTSLLHADASTMSLATEHLATEIALRASGIEYTILRNGWYTENYEGTIHGAVGAGAVLGSSGDGKISSATREDYAEAAVAVLTMPGHEGKTYELAGDDAFTLAEFAAEISRQTGRDIPFHNLPPEEYAAILKGVGLPEPLSDALASWDFEASKGWLFDDSRTLSHLIARPTTPYATTIAKIIG